METVDGSDIARQVMRNLTDNRSLAGDPTLTCDWSGSAWQNETTLHQLSPYIGKIKSSMAASLIAQFTREGNVVYDPFSGSGTIALEAWQAKRYVIANDLSPYASLLTRAKLFPYHGLEEALQKITTLAPEVRLIESTIDLRTVPSWVRCFYHTDTLREIMAWVTVLKLHRQWFLLTCLMGILHHQRPGFLSFPSSHTVPYLRTKMFPRSDFPELYEYRAVQERLEAKVRRAFRRLPNLDFSISRRCFSRPAESLVPSPHVDAIITSPPYMRQLDYGRDNRLRLWFLGSADWHTLDKRISPREDDFLNLMRSCFIGWKTLLRPGHFCVLVMGNTCSREDRKNLPQVVSRIATHEVGGYTHVCDFTEQIPNERRVRRKTAGSSSETILVLRNVSDRLVAKARS